MNEPDESIAPLPNPSPAEGERGRKKPPRWTIAFLRALTRTGDVRAAAEDAGIDHSTAYARRRTHEEFARLWQGALVAHEHMKRMQEEGAIAALRPLSPLACGESPSPAEGRGSSGAQLKRAGHDRWSQAKEKLFFDELAATANVKRAAAAAGVSTNAVYARRMKQPVFRAKWEAVLETGRAAIEMKLVEAANRTFDPDEIDVEGVEPKVSVAEAIRIVQLHGSKTQKQSIEQMEPPEEEIEAVRERLFNKLERLRKREWPKWLAQGWSHDAEHDHLVPPGWVRLDAAD